MPTYEYVCTSCRNHFDAVQSFSDPPLERCGLCGGELRRVFHPAGILFKGSGFYSTDNRRVGGQGSKGKPGEKSEKGDRADKGEQSEKGDRAESASKAETPAKSSTKTAEKSA